MRGLRTTRCSRNKTCNSETPHSKSIEKFAFAMHSARRLQVLVECITLSICPRNFKSLISIFVGLWEIAHGLETASSIAFTQFCFHSSYRPGTRCYSFSRCFGWQTSRIGSVGSIFWYLRSIRVLLLISRTLDIRGPNP